MESTSSGPLQHVVHVNKETNPLESRNPSDPEMLVGRAISPTSHSSFTEPTSVASVNWGIPSTTTLQQDRSSPMVVPTFPTKATGNPVVITSAPDAAAVPTFHIGSTNHPPPSSPPSSPHDSTPRRAGGGGGRRPADTNKPKDSTLNNRRQKRLERNRESARLSRRRRKQYLEVLEERVTKLSLDMDKGRREHVSRALATIQARRQQILTTTTNAVDLLQTVLSRCGTELKVATTFQTQQLQSLSLPPSDKFLLWLTLQNDTYFRGGRAASERLSAARIGERMLTSGNDRVPPSHGMWPLFCNEVCLSYDQEERVRSFQATLLTSPSSWIDRHAGAASKLAMDSTHDAMQSIMTAVGNRERAVLGCLSEEQKLKFLQWASNNAHKLQAINHKRIIPDQVGSKSSSGGGPEFSDKHHVAANLYILSNRMKRVVQALPPPRVLVSDSNLKRLSRRPSFESLGNSTAPEKQLAKEEKNRPLAREVSFSSEGSLKRSLDDIDQEGAGEGGGEEERHAIQSISPEDAQNAAGPAIEEALGFIKDLIPPPKPVPKAADLGGYVMPAAFKTPATQPVVQNYIPQQQQQAVPYMQTSSNQAVVPQQQLQQSQPFMQTSSNPAAPTTTFSNDQTSMASFLPPNLNVVPEEGFLPGSFAAEDFLFELTEEDWAIGAGLDMDTT